MAKKARKKVAAKKAKSPGKRAAKPPKAPARPAAPYFRTEIPGPKAAATIELDRRYSSPCYTRYIPLAVKRAWGATIEDVDGNLFLDFTAGIAVNATGHCHPEVVKAIRDQAGKLLHMCGSDYYNEPQAQLSRKLCEIAPGSSPKRMFFTNSGAESIEAAFKLARYHTGRQRAIAFLGGFHGRTLGALSLTGSKITQRAHFAPLVPEVHHIPYGYSYRSDYGVKTPRTRGEHLDALERLFKTIVPPDEVAGLFIEPIQGEGGYIVPPPGYLKALREICDRYGILMIVDEIQTGFGRTGKMFCLEYDDIEPDIICLAKGIASGLPLGAIVAKESVMDWKEGAHGSTFGGNPVSCRAALKSIELIEKQYLKNVQKVGVYMMSRLNEIKARFPERVADVRGRGLMLGMELVTDRKSRKPDQMLRDEVIEEAFYNGVVMIGSGESVLRFCPPLCLTQSEAKKGLAILEKALEKLVKRGPHKKGAPVATVEG